MAERGAMGAWRPIETIYAVQGSTGEYSDRTDWIVCGYADEAMAREHAEGASREADGIFAVYESDHLFGREGRKDAACSASLTDPHMQMDYTGTSYTVLCIYIRTSLPALPTTSETEGGA